MIVTALLSVTRAVQYLSKHRADAHADRAGEGSGNHARHQGRGRHARRRRRRHRRRVYLRHLPEKPHHPLAPRPRRRRGRSRAGPRRPRAEEFGVAALTIDALLAHPEIEIVLNLTIPAAHGAVCLQALEHGKSVYTEKPLALDRDEARRILDTAREKGLLVGSAPDTFLGAGLQTVRRLLDEGTIGEPVAFTARMITRGHERWHPDPAFYYQPGAGPMLDMGPYYVTALTTLLGPVARVASLTRATFPTRTITSQPRHGETIAVNTPTHIEALLEFRSGVVGSLMTTFDLWDPEHSAITIYGSEGSLRLPDPNTFGGPIFLLRGATRGGARSRSTPGSPTTRAVSAWRTWPPPCARARRFGRTATSVTMHWMSCWRPWNPPPRAATSRSRAPSSARPRLPEHPVPETSSRAAT